MNNNFGLSSEDAGRLLGIAGEKLGADPEELRSQLESGHPEGLLGRLDPEKQAQMSRLLGDPEALKRTLASPGVQAMLKALLGKKE